MNRNASTVENPVAMSSRHNPTPTAPHTPEPWVIATQQKMTDPAFVAEMEAAMASEEATNRLIGQVVRAVEKADVPAEIKRSFGRFLHMVERMSLECLEEDIRAIHDEVFRPAKSIDHTI